MNKTPIFISGIGRSGTSAVIKSLAEHQSVVKPERIGEAPFVAHFINFLMDYEDNSSGSAYNLKNYQLNAERRAEEFSRLCSMLQYGRDINQPISEGEHWIAKVSLHEEAFNKARSVFGTVRVVYVMRNGIEVVNSARSFPGFAHLNFEQLCQRWVDNIEQCRYVHTQDGCAVIKHHELVDEPEAVYAAVFKKLGLPQDKGPANFIATNLFNSSFDQTAKNTSTSKVFNSRLQCWDDWTDTEKAIFISKCDGLMQEFGFVRPYEDTKAEILAIRSNSTFTTDAPPIAAEAPREQSAASESMLAFHKELAASMNRGQFNYFANPSAKYNYLFMENPKVASTSILSALHEAEADQDFVFPENPHVRAESPIPMMKSLPEDRQVEALTGADTFRFTFVRNPFRRLVSAYLSKIDRPYRAKAEILAVLNGVSPAEITDLTQTVSFREFVEVISTMDGRSMNPHWKPQVDQVVPHLIDYDLIGRFENLADDFGTVCERVMPGKNISLSRSMNKTRSREAFDALYTPDLIKMVLDIYERDFVVFNYSSNPEQIEAIDDIQQEGFKLAM